MFSYSQQNVPKKRRCYNEGRVVKMEFNEVTKKITEEQREFLKLRLFDVPVKDCCALIKREPQTIRVWRLGGSEFKKVEEEVMANYREYAQDVRIEGKKTIDAKVFKMLESLIDIVNDKGWEEVQKELHQPAISAAKLLLISQPDPTRRSRGKTSYEERILMSRKVVEDATE